MVSLNLSGGSKRLPASAFPDWADEYFCDNCGRDVTKQLCRRESHSWRPMGAERFLCACGRSWLTGAAEWDHLGSPERGKRIGAVIIANIVFSGVAFLFGLFAYFLSSEANVALAAGLITFSLLLLLQVKSWFGVMASIYRTRLRSGSTSKEN